MARVKRTLISVYNKDGLLEFAKGLHELGVKILSTGGTAKVIEKGGIEVEEVSEHTGFPEVLEGRVKTLHPNIHVGILAKRSKRSHSREMKEHGIEPIDLVVVNLCPFPQKSAQSMDEALENIDIGGVALVRAAAKNFPDVGVVVDRSDYPHILDELKQNKLELSMETKLKLARKAFAHTARYEEAIAGYFSTLKLP